MILFMLMYLHVEGDVCGGGGHRSTLGVFVFPILKSVYVFDTCGRGWGV